MRVCVDSVNGWLTGMSLTAHASYEDAEPQRSENSRNNSWNMNFNNGNLNNNNKYNQNRVRPCTEFAKFNRLVDTFFVAYEDCLRGKRSSTQTLEYMPTAAEDIPLLAWEVWTRTYEPSVSTCFMVTFPKLREVFAAAFRDRIVHHWICLRLVPLFEQRCKELGDVSHACRRGYGTKTAIGQVQQGMLRVSDHLQKEAWIYKGDIVGFFMNIRKSLLWAMLKDLIETRYQGDDKEILLYLTEITVMHRPEKNCVIQSDIKMWQEIRADKSLFFIGEDMGEPIGNLTTQRFADYYMSFLDEYIEKLFEGKNYSYTRSVDDFVIVCDDRIFLRHAIKDIRTFAQKELGLECHSDKVYFQPVSHGVRFLGQIMYCHRRYTINRTVGRFIDRVKVCLLECECGLTEIRAEYWTQVINSYFGFLLQANEYRIRTKVFKMLTEVWYAYFSIENRKKIIIKHYRYDNKRNQDPCVRAKAA